MHNIKKWRGKICSKAIQNSTNNHNTSDISGTICQSPPCDPYVGPELYFEYFSNGRWKSMKNPNGRVPQGFEVPANKTRVYSYHWNTGKKTSFRLRVKNAMKKDQFDFMMDQPDPVIDDGDDDDGNGGSGSPVNPEEFPQLPSHIKLSGGQDLIVDFTTIIDGKPRITLPLDYLPALPYYDGEPIIPNNFCGIRVINADRFIWETGQGELVNTFPYNYVPQNSSVEQLFGINYSLGGIEFTGPIGACAAGNDNWHFPFPFTQTNPVMNEPLRLTIELIDSQIEFLNYNIKPQKTLSADELFKEVDFDKFIKFFNETFYDGFQNWIDAVCEENPSECPLED